MTTDNNTPRDDEQTPADATEASAPPPPAVPPAEPEPAAEVVSPAEGPTVVDQPDAASEREPVAASEPEPAAETRVLDEQPRDTAASDAPPATDDAPTERYAPPPPAAGSTASPASTSEPQVVYVSAPQPPRRKSARGVGAAVVLLSTGIFAVLYAAITVALAFLLRADGLNGITDYLASPPFWVPVLIFFLAYLLLVIIVNRAGWWAHVLGGFIVAVVVWLGFIGAALIASGTIGGTAADQQAVILQQLVNPLGVAAAVLAREIPIWVGGMVARRGRTVTARNAEARETYERDLAEHRASLGPQGTTPTS